MNVARQNRRDFWQNVSIAVLTVSAVLLFAATQLYTLSGINGYLGFFSESSAQPQNDATDLSTPLTAPLRIAVTGTYGRYGSVSLSTENQGDFTPLFTLLGDALRSVQTFSTCEESEFLNALNNTSVYYDFLNPLPLSFLAELVRVERTDTIATRQFILSKTAEGVNLYLWDGTEQYLCGVTTLTMDDLSNAVSRYELGNASFALDFTETVSEQPHLSPCSLFLNNEPTLTSLSAQTMSNVDFVLNTLQFNPNTKSRYTESSGTEVIVEDGRSLRIHTDGRMIYQGGDIALTVDSEHGQVTLPELISGSSALLNRLLSFYSNDAVLYLKDVQQDSSTTTLTFDYQVDGVPVHFSNGDSAATITLSDTNITSLNLYFRQYLLSGSNTLLLPLRQAMAIATQEKSSELFIGYVDHGNSTVHAGWISE